MSKIALPRNYRIQVKNEAGVTLASNAVKVYMRRVKTVMVDPEHGVSAIRILATVPRLVYDEEVKVFDNAGTIADGAFAEGTAQDNSGIDDQWEGADIRVRVSFPVSASGQILVDYQISTDGGINFYGDGSGIQVFSVPGVSSAGVYMAGEM